MLHRRQLSEGSRMENQDLIEASDKKKKEPLMHHIHAPPMQVPPRDAAARRLNISRPLSFSKRSLNISRQSFASEIPESDFIKLPNVTVFIHSLAFISIASLAYSAVAFYVLNTFLDIQQSLNRMNPDDISNENDSQKSGSYSSNYKLCNTGVALTSYVLAASFCCFMISSMQNVFASKVMKMNEGEERVYKYLEECSSSRILAIAGFFLCIPISFIDMAIYLSLRSPGDSNVVGVVLLALGALLGVMGGAHSCFYWREERIRAHSGMPVYDSRFSVPANLASFAAPIHNIV